MGGRIHDGRNYILPGINDSTGSASPVSTVTPQPKSIGNKFNNNYSDNQFILPSQAFVPIKDSNAVQKETKKREIEAIFQQQTKLQEKVRDLELSNQHLIAEVNSLKRNNKEAPTLDGQTEHALRNATDMTLYLTKKLQNMHEAITKLEVRLSQQEKNLQEEKGGLAALADKIVEIESTGVTSCEERLTKQGNELLMYRDSLQDLKKKLMDEQIDRKNNEQKILEIIHRSKEENRQQSQQTQPQPQIPAPQFAITPKIEEKMVEIAENVFNKNKPAPLPTSPVAVAKPKSSDFDKLLQDEVNRLQQLENDLKKNDNKRWTEFKKEQEQELQNLHQTVKVDRSKLNQEFKMIKESISILADKHIDHNKAMQEKLQAEILTRQQFECDTLRQMTMLDEKLIKLGSAHPNIDPKKFNSGKSELMLREVDSLKKLILETERNLEQKIENSVSKLKPTNNVIIKKEDTNKNHDYEELEEKIEKFRLVGEKNTNDLKQLDEWKTAMKEEIEDVKQEVDRLKNQVKKLPSQDWLNDINRRIHILDESADDYKLFKESTEDSIENLKKKIKMLNELSANKNPGKKTPTNEYSVPPNWKEQVELNIEEIQKDVKHLNEKIHQYEQKISHIKMDVEKETKERLEETSDLREQIKSIKPVEIPKNESNSAKEGLKKLANALQGTKSVLAMKMQYEEKERQGAVEFLQKQIDDTNNLLEELEKKMNSKEKTGNKDDAPKKKSKPKKNDPNNDAADNKETS